MKSQSNQVRKGTIYNETYRVVDGQQIVGQKSTLDKERFLTDPNFVRTRENAAEFGNAATSGKLINAGFKPAVPKAIDRLEFSRLVRRNMAIIKTDVTNVRGERTVADGDITLLEGFNFNGRSNMSTTFQAPAVFAIDRVTGELSVDLAAFVPDVYVDKPEGATHFKLLATGAEVDFDNETILTDVQSTGYLALDNNATSPVTLTATVSAGSTLPLILSFGIEYFEEVNGVKYILSNGRYNAHQIVKVDV